MVDVRPLRADAKRNRARVLEVAAQVFAADGLSVPVQEIARRAGVGTGTVSRHFPTKEDLFEAVARARVDELLALADELAQHEEAGAAFALFFEAVVRECSADRGLAEHLSALASDKPGLAQRVGLDALCDRLGAILSKAQDVGAVRPDVALADVEALMSGCISREGDPHMVISVVNDGLKPSTSLEFPAPRQD